MADASQEECGAGSRTRMLLKDTKNKSARWQAATEGILSASACDTVLSMKQRAGQAGIEGLREAVHLHSVTTKPWVHSGRVHGDGVRVAFDLLIEHEAAQAATTSADDHPHSATGTAALPVECLRQGVADSLAPDSMEPLPKIYQFVDVEEQQQDKKRRERLLRSGLLTPGDAVCEAATDARAKSFTCSTFAASVASRTNMSHTTSTRSNNKSGPLRSSLHPKHRASVPLSLDGPATYDSMKAADLTSAGNLTSTPPRTQPSSMIMAHDGGSTTCLEGLDPQLALVASAGFAESEGCMQTLDMVSEETGASPAPTPRAPSASALKHTGATPASVSGTAFTARSKVKESVLTERIKRTGQAFTSLVQKLRPRKVQVAPVAPEATAGQMVEGSHRDVHSSPMFLYNGLGREQPTQYLLSGMFLEPGTAAAQTEPFLKLGTLAKVEPPSETGSAYSSLSLGMSSVLNTAQATSAPPTSSWPRPLQLFDASTAHAQAARVLTASSHSNNGMPAAPDSPVLAYKPGSQALHVSMPTAPASKPATSTIGTAGRARPSTSRPALTAAWGSKAKLQGSPPGSSTTVWADLSDSVPLPGAADTIAAVPPAGSTQHSHTQVSVKPIRNRRASMDGPCSGPCGFGLAVPDPYASSAVSGSVRHRRASVDSMPTPCRLSATPASLAAARSASRASMETAISAVIIAKTQPAALPMQLP